MYFFFGLRDWPLLEVNGGTYTPNAPWLPLNMASNVGTYTTTMEHMQHMGDG